MLGGGKYDMERLRAACLRGNPVLLTINVMWKRYNVKWKCANFTNFRLSFFNDINTHSFFKFFKFRN